MVVAIRFAVVVASSLGVSQGARRHRGHQLSGQDSDLIRLVQGGSMASGGTENPAMDIFRNLPAKGVKYFSAASADPVSGQRSLRDFLLSFGVNDPEWIPVYSSNCAERTQDPTYIRMVEEADAIYIGGGQSGRVSSCLFGNYSQRGINGGEETPLLRALQAKRIVGGSSAGAMTQPMSEILVTGHSEESYDAVRSGQVYQVDSGNNLLGAEQAVDTHFSERGRQGRLLVFAMQTQLQWAFGVDEATAYIWRPSGVYEVTGGNNGVVIFQGANGTRSSQRARMHYLTGGDTIDINTGIITYSSDKTRCSTSTAPSSSSSIFNGGGSNVYKRISIATAQAPVGTRVVNRHGWWSPVEAIFTNTAETLAMCGPSGESFENLEVEQSSSPTVAFAEAEREVPNVPEHYIYPLDN